MGGSSKKQTIGYKYFAAIHMVLCHGVLDSIRQISVENKNLIKGDYNSGSHPVSKPDLFGGESSQGGISGVIEIMDGDPNQQRSDKLIELQGKISDPDYVPAYRGVASILLRGSDGFFQKSVEKPGGAFSKLFNTVAFQDLFNQGSKKGMYLGMNPYLKTWKTMVQRIMKKSDGADQWYPEKAKILTRAAIDPKAFNLKFTSSNSIIDASYNPDTLEYDWNSGGSSGSSATLLQSSQFYVSSGQNEATITLTISGYNQNDSDEQYIYMVLNKNSSDESDNLTTLVLPDGVILSSSNENGGGSGNWEYEILIPVKNKTYTFTNKNVSAESGYINISLGVVTTQNLYDMNPAHIIRECITDKASGLGEHDSLIDDASFIYAADYFYDKKIGMSIAFTKEGTIEDFISEILRHISAFLYVEPTTGKYKLKLAIDDYNVEDLITLNPSNIISLGDYSKSTFSELLNQVTVTYKNLSNDTNSTLTVQDIALISMSGGLIKSKSIKYEGFTNSTTASRAALRDLKTISTPLVSCEIQVKRSIGLGLRQGDVFVLDWQKYFIDGAVMRISEIDFGDAKSNVVTIVCMEDIFSMPDTSTVTTDDSILNPIQLEAIRDQISFEFPYLELVQRFGQSQVDSELDNNEFASYFGVAVVKPNDSVSFGELYIKNIDGSYTSYGQVNFCPFGKLTETLERDENQIIIEEFNDFDAITNLPVWAQIGDELVSITGIEDIVINSTNTTAKLLTVKRGILDTQVDVHYDGDSVFVWDVFNSSDENIYAMGEDVFAKVTSATLTSAIGIDDAKEISHRMQSRAIRPYPPQNVRIDGQYFPQQVINSMIMVEWSHRNRTQQTGGEYIGWYESNITPENGVSYTVNLYVDNNLHTTSVTTDNFYEIDLTDTRFSTNVKIEVISERDGHECLNPFEWTFVKLSGVSRPINLTAIVE